MQHALTLIRRLVPILAGLALALVAALPAAGTGTPAVFYADPAGSGTVCSLDAPCSLVGVRDKIRAFNGAMTGDILAYLRGGTYALAAPLQLGPQDSGTGGHSIIYRAYPGEAPVLSGGAELAGWSLYDSGKNIYRASTSAGLALRQLFVNGARATRARGTQNPPGFAKNATGFTTTDASMQSWGNPGEIEIVSFRSWKNYRCRVASIAGLNIAIQNPCWNNVQLDRPFAMDQVTWVENAYELLDAPGEWYYDRATGYVYYIPRPGEDLATARVIAPAAEGLVSGTGTLATPIHDIVFDGLSFSYAAWLAPSTPEGYADVQAGFRITGAGLTSPPPPSEWTKTPASVTFRAARRVSFYRNNFTHLGGAGLTFEYGSQNDSIVANRFEDISSNAIQIGDIDDYATTDPHRMSTGLAIKNNLILRAGAEYYDTVGIWAGYTAHTQISHNEIADLPYSGISVGWGWGQPSYARDNAITGNHIYNVLRTLRDGGGIYTLSSQPGALIRDNYIHQLGNDFAAIYLDEGTQQYVVERNVVAAAPQWLYLNARLVQNNTAQQNFAETAAMTDKGLNSVIRDNTVVASGLWPPAAITIINGAGIEPAYRSIKSGAPVELGLARAARASSAYSDLYNPAKANDGNPGSGWSPLGKTLDTQPWWQVDLGGAYTLAAIELVTRQDVDQPETRHNFQIWGSNDPNFASFTLLGGQGTTILPFRGTWSLGITNNQPFRYLRAIKTIANEYFFIAELRIRGRLARSGAEVYLPLAR